MEPQNRRDMPLVAGRVTLRTDARIRAIVNENASTMSRTVERLLEEALDARDRAKQERAAA